MYIYIYIHPSVHPSIHTHIQTDRPAGRQADRHTTHTTHNTHNTHNTQNTDNTHKHIFIYLHIQAFGTSFSLCHTVSNAVMPICTACPKFHFFFQFPSPSMLAFMDHMLVGLCPHLLLRFIYKTHLLKQFLIEAMDIKQPEPQNLKNYLKLLHLNLPKPHRLHHLLPLRLSPQKNLSGNIELLPGSLLLQRHPEQTKDGKSFSLHCQLWM